MESSIRCMPVALPSLFCIVEEQFLATKFNFALLCFAHHKVLGFLRVSLHGRGTSSFLKSRSIQQREGHREKDTHTQRVCGIFRMCFHILCLQKACKSLAVAVSQLSGFLSILFVLSFCVAIAGASENQAASVCSRPPTLLDEVLLPVNESCPAALHHEIFLSSAAAGVSLLPRVAELNETALEKALDLVHSNNGTYIAVLYYASWCPFSRELRPVYDVLSSVFPSIHHVAVEESSVRPSVLSQYGVHSFPVVFVHNRTSRVRYHGSRTLEDFVYFYQNYTGLRCVSGGQVVKHADCGFAKLVFNVGKGVKEVCPYPWAISPQNWLQEDAYLTLAFLFLILRLLYILLPIVASAWTLY